MITPHFSCSQTDKSVIVRIYAPSVRASDVEIHVEGTLFSLHINPYFLKLVFSGELIEDDDSSAVYDPSSGYLTATLTKARFGEEFKDLDILAKLLASTRPDPEQCQPLKIEVLHSTDSGDQDGEDMTQEQRELLEAAESDWQLPQIIPSDTVSISVERRYGFLDAYTGYFRHVLHTENEINDLGGEVESLSPEERRTRRIQHEDEKWDPQYYVAEFIDEDNVQMLIRYLPPEDAPYYPNFDDAIVFSEAENLEMLRLPRKEYLTTPQQQRALYLTLLTILFSYVYDARTTQDDPTPESAWTICSLTPACSALDPPPYTPSSLSLEQHFAPEEIQDALLPSIHRSLAYPLYRSFALAVHCLRDVSIILRRGCRAVLRALLSTKRILDQHEVYYVYSKIWLDDFCRWASNYANEDILRSLGESLADLHFDKCTVRWNLPALESAATEEMSEEHVQGYVFPDYAPVDNMRFDISPVRIGFGDGGNMHPEGTPVPSSSSTAPSEVAPGTDKHEGTHAIITSGISELIGTLLKSEEKEGEDKSESNDAPPDSSSDSDSDSDSGSDVVKNGEKERSSPSPSSDVVGGSDDDDDSDDKD